MTFRPARRDTVIALSGLLAGVAVAAAIAAAVWPSSGSSGANKDSAKAAATAPTLAPDPVNETLRPKEIVLPSQHPYTSGKIVLMPLRLTCGLSSVIGTHAEQDAVGQYCRVRVALTGNDSFTHSFDATKTALTTTAGATVGLSYDGQEVERQPIQIAQVGSHDRYEFDIYYDVPRDATVNGFTFAGDQDAPPVTVPLPVRQWPFS